MKALYLAGGVLAGIATALVLLIAVELFSSVVHPFPDGLDFDSQAAMCKHVANYPDWVLATIVPMWASVAGASGFTARKIGGRWASGVVGTLLLAGVAANVSMLPYPVWFRIAAVVAIAWGGFWTGNGFSTKARSALTRTL